MKKKNASLPIKAITQLSRSLSFDERDALKFKLSVEAIHELGDDFELSPPKPKRKRFQAILQSLTEIQPYKDRLSPYGIAYRGFPDFLTEKVLRNLQHEAVNYRKEARLNFDQFLAQVDTPDGSTFGEKLERSKKLHELVKQHAGPCSKSYITSYIYYDSPGHCSSLHVDNAFTAITVMIGLKHEYQDASNRSRSVVYWPGLPRLDYNLQPGEVVIFFGTTMLHGRTPVGKNEIVHSMLLSFRPD